MTIQIGAVALGVFTVYEIILIVDFAISNMMEKHYDLWPLYNYYCVCGYHIKVNNLYPVNTYRMIKVVKHENGCLSKLMYFWGSNLTPKWQYHAMRQVATEGKVLGKLDWGVLEDLSREELGLPKLPYDPDRYS